MYIFKIFNLKDQPHLKEVLVSVDKFEGWVFLDGILTVEGGGIREIIPVQNKPSFNATTLLNYAGILLSVFQE